MGANGQCGKGKPKKFRESGVPLSETGRRERDNQVVRRLGISVVAHDFMMILRLLPTSHTRRPIAVVLPGWTKDQPLSIFETQVRISTMVGRRAGLCNSQEFGEGATKRLNGSPRNSDQARKTHVFVFPVTSSDTITWTGDPIATPAMYGAEICSTLH